MSQRQRGQGCDAGQRQRRRQILYINTLLTGILVGLTATVYGKINHINRKTQTLYSGIVRTLWAAIILFIVTVGFLLFDLITNAVLPRKAAGVGAMFTILSLIVLIFSGMTSDSITNARRQDDQCSYYNEDGNITSGSGSPQCTGCKSTTVRLSRTCCCCVAHRKCKANYDKRARKCRGSYVTVYEKVAFVGVDSCEAILSDSALYGALVSSAVFYGFVTALFALWSWGTMADVSARFSFQRGQCCIPAFCRRLAQSVQQRQTPQATSNTRVHSTHTAATAQRTTTQPPHTANGVTQSVQQCQTPQATSNTSVRSTAATAQRKTTQPPHTAKGGQSKCVVQPNHATRLPAKITPVDQSDIPHDPPPDYDTVVNSASTGKQN